MRAIATLSTFVLLLSATACDTPGEPVPPSSVVPIEHLRVTPLTVHFSAAGQTQQLTATIAPDNATDQALIWESDNTAVATVSQSGLVTAQDVGGGIFVTAYAHAGGVQASVNVSVDP
jgi:hypothetical protein